MSKLKIKDLNTVANVYSIPTVGTGATIKGSLEGDVIVIDGNSTEYTVKAAGNKLTISGINDLGKKFSVSIAFDKSKTAIAQTAKVAFADGTVTFAFSPVAKTISVGGTPLPKKFDAGVSTLPIDSTVTADDFAGSTGTGGQTPTLGKTLTLTTGVDEFTPTTSNTDNQTTAGNDTFVAKLGDDKNDTTADDSTLTALDTLDGGLGVNALRIDDVSGGNALPSGLTLSNIQLITARSAGDLGNDNGLFDVSNIAGLKTINATLAEDVFIKAAATTDVNVSGVTGGNDGEGEGDAGLILVEGGNNVTVIDGAYQNDIFLGFGPSIQAVAGNVVVTDSAQNGAAIRLNGGKDVTITTVTKDSAQDAQAFTGAVALGLGGSTPFTAVAGAVKVNQSITSDGTSNLQVAGVKVTGGTTVELNKSMTVAAKDELDNGFHFFSQDIVDSAGTATSVSIKTTYSETEFTKPAVAEVKATTDVTFKALAAGQFVTLAGLTFTASKDLTAAQVAAAFGGLTNEDLQDNGGIVANGVYTNKFAGNLTTSEANGAVVTLMGAGGAPISFDSAGSVAEVLPTVSNAKNGTAPVAAITSSNQIAYQGSAIIDKDGAATIKTVSLDGFGGFTSLNNTSALETLNLTNGFGANNAVLVNTSASTLTANLKDVNVAKASGNVLALIDTTTLNLNVTGVNAMNIQAAALKTLNVAGTGALDAGDGQLGLLETLKVSGSVTMGRLDPALAALTSVDTTANTGKVTLEINHAGIDTAYAGGAGVDNVTVADETTDKSIALGAGNDTLIVGKAVLGAFTFGTGTFDGGAGDSDVLGLLAGDAALASAGVALNAAVSGFEVLSVRDAAGASVINLDNVDAISRVVFEAAAGTSELRNLASAGTVTYNANNNKAISILTVKNAVAGAADSLNLNFNVNAANVQFGAIRINDVESATITATDLSPVAPGVVNNAVIGLLQEAGTASDLKTVTVKGNANVELAINGDNLALTKVDAATLTGGLSYTADGALLGTEVVGGAGSDDLIAEGEKDILRGGAGDDYLLADQLTQLFGGAGKDTFEFLTNENLAKVSTINDFGSGDVIDLTATKFFAEGAQFNPNTATSILERVNAALEQTDAGEASWFNFGGNTYVVQEGEEDGVTYVAGDDLVIEIIGTFNLGTQASFNASSGTLELI